MFILLDSDYGCDAKGCYDTREQAELINDILGNRCSIQEIEHNFGYDNAQRGIISWHVSRRFKGDTHVYLVTDMNDWGKEMPITIGESGQAYYGMIIAPNYQEARDIGFDKMEAFLKSKGKNES